MAIATSSTFSWPSLKILVLTILDDPYRCIENIVQFVSLPSIPTLISNFKKLQTPFFTGSEGGRESGGSSHHHRVIPAASTINSDVYAISNFTMFVTFLVLFAKKDYTPEGVNVTG